MKAPIDTPNAELVLHRSDERHKPGSNRAAIKRGLWVGPIALLVLVVAAIVMIPRAPATHQPAAVDPAITQYITMVGADEARLLSSQSNHCLSVEDAGCPAAAAPVIAAAQEWLDDLDTSRPPARFAGVDAQMRRHLVLVIGDLKALVAAFRAKDQDGMNTAFGTGIGERDRIVAAAANSMYSRQGTLATYTSNVRRNVERLLRCTPCQQLLSRNQVYCSAAQMQGCPAQIAATRLAVEDFQGDLVRVFAPDSLSSKDSVLQAHLLAADMALGAMTSALAASDQIELQAGANALLLALAQADSDAANILSGK